MEKKGDLSECGMVSDAISETADLLGLSYTNIFHINREWLMPEVRGEYPDWFELLERQQKLKSSLITMEGFKRASLNTQHITKDQKHAGLMTLLLTRFISFKTTVYPCSDGYARSQCNRAALEMEIYFMDVPPPNL